MVTNTQTSKTKYEAGIIIPVYHSTVSVLELLQELQSVLNNMPFHVYLVDDSEDQKTFEYLSTHCLKSFVTLIHLLKNSGQQNAILCGIRIAVKDCKWLVIMDDDGQHPPKILPHMFQKLEQGSNLVYAIPLYSKRNIIRELGSKARDHFFTTVFDLPDGSKISSYRILSQQLAADAAATNGRFFYLSAACLRNQAHFCNITYPACQRDTGHSGYKLFRLIELYMNLWRYYHKDGTQSSDSPELYQIDRILEGRANL